MQCSDSVLQAVFGLLGNGSKPFILNNTQHHLWIGDLNTVPIVDRPYDHIARQEKPYCWLYLQRTMRQVWIASSQNKRGWHLQTQFLVQRVPNIDTGITPLLESIEVYPVLKFPPKFYWFLQKSLFVSPFSCQLSCQDSERETCVN
ncbi:hypothetical protein KDAU_07550 [Dictyobacter aurantiacus]|uniref:Uncharacterized protein n=1 Tax=Dictyobacter aurantiacus TaxID=1936993 RepID=A0A401Z9F2_9CHLR|nr:hypothetical protein [Dictyobacter aurantiacus]GCE03426.1 hypothetical protein KDAU_07550 [Dictyobacter aurantiacus]